MSTNFRNFWTIHKTASSNGTKFFFVFTYLISQFIKNIKVPFAAHIRMISQKVLMYYVFTQCIIY